MRNAPRSTTENGVGRSSPRRQRNNNSDNSGVSATDPAKLSIAPSVALWAFTNIAFWALAFYLQGKSTENKVTTPGAPTRFVPDAVWGALGGLSSAGLMMGYKYFMANPSKNLLTSAFPQGEGNGNNLGYNDPHYNLVDPRDRTPPGGPSNQILSAPTQGPSEDTWAKRIIKQEEEMKQETTTRATL